MPTASVPLRIFGTFTLVIDEFQEFQRVNPSVFSTMQRDWDRFKGESRINLIVSGSINRMMEFIFSESEPLYGRATHEISLCLQVTRKGN